MPWGRPAGSSAAADGTPKENRSCDAAKSPTGHLRILNPLRIPPSPRVFRYAQDGEIIPDPTNATATDTIEELNLNCPRLKRLRGKVHEILQAQLREAIPKKGGYSAATAYLSKVYFQQNPAKPWPSFFTLIRFKLGSEAEAHLLSLGFRG